MALTINTTSPAQRPAQGWTLSYTPAILVRETAPQRPATYGAIACSMASIAAQAPRLLPVGAAGFPFAGPAAQIVHDRLDRRDRRGRFRDGFEDRSEERRVGKECR